MSPASLATFQQQCPLNATVTLIGPLLESCPTWPDGPLIFVDGGAKWQAQLPQDFGFAHLSVGDGDSLGCRQLDVVLDMQKDFSDLGYALQVLKSLPIERLILNGFLGGRRDHEWINFGVVANFLKSHRQVLADFEGEVTLFAPGEYTLDHKGLFSLVHFENGHTRIRGAVDYPLLQATHLEAYSSHGLSNCASGTFKMSSDVVTLCFFSA